MSVRLPIIKTGTGSNEHLKKQREIRRVSQNYMQGGSGTNVRRRLLLPSISQYREKEDDNGVSQRLRLQCSANQLRYGVKRFGLMKGKDWTGSVGDLLIRRQEKIWGWRMSRGVAHLSSDRLLINITRGTINGPSQISLKETIQFLINNGADINMKINSYGDRLIHCLATEGRSEAIRVLIECGANVGVETNDGGTALLIAVVHNHAEVIHALSQSEGVNVNDPSKSGWTPMFIAAQEGNMDAIDALYKCGADVNRPSKGKTPLLIARNKGHEMVIRKLVQFGAK